MLTKWKIPGTDETFYSDRNPSEARHDWTNLKDLKHANAAAGYHWFSPDTLRFFGSLGMKLVSGAVVEEQTRAPLASLRFRVTWFDAQGRSITSAAYSTRANAINGARLVAEVGFVKLEDES